MIFQYVQHGIPAYSIIYFRRWADWHKPWLLISSHVSYIRELELT